MKCSIKYVLFTKSGYKLILRGREQDNKISIKIYTTMKSRQIYVQWSIEGASFERGYPTASLQAGPAPYQPNISPGKNKKNKSITYKAFT